MISKPEATCPRCESRLTVLDAINVSRHAETVTYYCECDCGAASLTVTRGQVTAVTPMDPIQIPNWTDDPITEEEYIAHAQ